MCFVLVLSCARLHLKPVGLFFLWVEEYLGDLFLTRLFVLRNGGLGHIGFKENCCNFFSCKV